MELILVLAEVLALVVVAAVELFAAVATALVPILADLLLMLVQSLVRAISRRWPATVAARARDSVPVEKRSGDVEKSVSFPACEPRCDLPTAVSTRGLSAKWRRRLVIGFATVSSVSLVSLLVLDLFFVGPAVRWALRDLNAKSGIELQFDRASGHLLLGQIELHGIRAKREENRFSNFDLKSPHTQLQISLWKVLWSKTAFERVVVEGLAGTYERIGVDESHPAKRGFEIGVFELIHCDLKVTDRTVEGEPVSLTVVVDKLECSPLRSLVAPFDILFRSNVAGTIDGNPFSVACRKTTETRETEWHFLRLPVSLAGSYFRGPFRWFTEGSLELHVENRWSRKPTAKEHLKCHFILQDIQAETPDDLTPRKKVIAELAVRYFNAHSRKMDFGFDLELDANSERLDINSTADLKAIWKEIEAATMDAFFDKCSEKVEEVKDKVKKKANDVVDRAKGKLEQLKNGRK